MNKKKTKYSPEVLKEELNKFKLLSEYSFYTGENDVKHDEENLILGDIEEADDAPADLEPVDSNADTDKAADAVADDLGVDDTENPGGDEEVTGDIEDVDVDAATAPEPQPEAPADDEVELDVTDLVKGSEEAKQAAANASNNTNQLLAKFSELEGKVAAMDNITKKIDTLEKEIVKRNPTPVEKLEMRSLNSYPYSLKLTDYWAEKEGTHDVTSGEGVKKEYILTKDDVNSDYSDSKVKQSFKVNPNDFTEEDI